MESRKCNDDCAWDSFMEGTGRELEASKLSNTADAENSRSCSDPSTANNMCASSALKTDGYVYKRRKLQGNTIAFLPDEIATEVGKGSANSSSSISDEDNPLTTQKDDIGVVPVISAGLSNKLHHVHEDNLVVSGQEQVEKPFVVVGLPCVVMTPNSLPFHRGYIGEGEAPAEAYITNCQISKSECGSGVNDSFSSSKSIVGHVSSTKRREVEDPGECSSSSDIGVAKPLEEFTSSRELCISVLKSHGLLSELWTGTASTSLEFPDRDHAKFSQPCKICSVLEHPRKMLICDHCEEAFHVSCCNPQVKKLPVDEWYCQPCFIKRPKPLLDNISGKRSKIKGEISERSVSRRSSNPILSMLGDLEPYTTGVRVGKDFQVETPEWSGPISEDDDYFDEPLKLDPTECSSLNGWNCSKPSKPSSIGNWIQCRAVIYKDSNDDEGTICGKWRRAPLFVAQTHDWDCSCSISWDPIHADCAVPQELDTATVLKHLKYVQALRPRLMNHKSKANQAENNDHD